MIGSSFLLLFPILREKKILMCQRHILQYFSIIHHVRLHAYNQTIANVHKNVLKYNYRYILIKVLEYNYKYSLEKVINYTCI
jgi:hypothetical protein